MFATRGCLLLASLSAASATSGAECAKKLVWFDQIDKQAEMSSNEVESFAERDALFDAKASSVAAKHANCGDTAAGQSQDCSGYNKWDTMQTIADNRKMKFAVFKDHAPKLLDINQGGLGDCYFLAALASVASARPAFIQDMFSHKEEWANDVYTTKWRLSGADVEVAVNSKVPVGEGSYYTSFAHGGEDDGTLVFWPVILEKAWAKIFGSYKAMEGGVWGQVIASLSSANVLSASHRHVEDEDHVWNMLEQGTNKKFPMGAGTSTHSNPKAYGLVEGHQYTVIKTTNYNGERAVECFNPWSKDHYSGEVPNDDESDGKFTMTFKEYMDAFGSTEVAEMHQGYRTSSKTVDGESGVMEGLFEFTVALDAPFTVGVHWPSQHLFPEGCDLQDPQVTLVVAKKGDYQQLAMGNENGRQYGINAARAEVTTGAGSYIVFFNAKFKDSTWIPSVHLTVYASEEVRIKESNEAQDLVVKAMLLPSCDDDTITVDVAQTHWNGLFKLAHDELIGVPYFVSSDGEHYLYFEGDKGHWTFIEKGNWDRVVAGTHFTTPGYDRDQLGQCGVHDSKALGGFHGMTCDDVVLKKFSNILCEDSEYTDTVLRYCPESCAQMKAGEEDLRQNPEAAMPDCTELTLRGRGRFKDGLFNRKPDEKIEGVPIYVSLDDKTVMYYKGSCQAWSLIGKNQWGQVLDGANFDTPCFHKNAAEVHCGRHDAAQIGPYGLGCDVVRRKVYNNVNCQGLVIQRYCAETCTSNIEALDLTLPHILDDAGRGDGRAKLSAGSFQLGAAVLLVSAAALVLGGRTARRHGHAGLTAGSADAQATSPMILEEFARGNEELQE